MPDAWTLSDSAANNWKKATVTAAVQQDWQHRSERGDRSQFRIKFQAENSGFGPKVWAKFASGDAANHQPMLTITYLAP